MDFEKYQRTQVAEMRPATEDDKFNARISISIPDQEAGSPKEGDMIARNPANHDDQWLVSAAYFAENFAPLAIDRTSDPVPSPVEFSDEQLATDPILKFFHYSHLPPQLQGTSKFFCNVARFITNSVPRNAERTVALRKLLEAKDAAVRANV